MMVSRKRERKRWRTETKLPYNNTVCIRARFLWCLQRAFFSRDVLALTETLNNHLLKRKNHRVKAAEERHQERAHNNGQSVLWKRFNEKKSRATRCFHVKVVVLYISRKKEEYIQIQHITIFTEHHNFEINCLFMRLFVWAGRLPGSGPRNLLFNVARYERVNTWKSGGDWERPSVLLFTRSIFKVPFLCFHSRHYQFLPAVHYHWAS